MNLQINDIHLNYSSFDWMKLINNRLGKNENLILCEVGIGNYTKCNLINFINSELNNKIILVEALPKFNQEIEYNIKDKKNIIHHKVAISDINGEVEFSDNNIESHINNTYSVAKFRKRIINNIIKIPSVTFDTIDPGDINVLFIDIEGSEYLVLKHLKSKPEIIRVELNIKGYVNPFLNEIEQWFTDNNYIHTDNIGSDRIYMKK